MSEAALPLAASPPRRAVLDRARRVLQTRLDDTRLALNAINGHKLRSGLTLLGIVIGVFTVVAMAAVLNGLKSTIDKQMNQLGANVFEIQRFPAIQFGPLSPEIQKRRKVTLSDVNHLREMSPLYEMHKQGIDLKTVQWAAH